VRAPRYRLRLLLVAAFALAATFAVVASACDGDGDERERLTVFAAASLTEAFTEAAARFEEDHPYDVTFNFAGSPALRAQLDQGAQADVYATADDENMQAALDAGLVEAPPVTFARNRMVIIVPAGNPGDIHLLPDIGTPGLRTVLAAPDVPAGRYAREVLDKIAADEGFVPGIRETVLANVVSEEPNVKAIVTKVQLGEADIGFVYATDVTPEIEDEVRVVEIPLDYNVDAAYPIAVTSEAANPEGAQAFVDFLLSDDGQDILAKHGFERAS